MESIKKFDVEQFIKEVKCRPVLWDLKHPNYNHRQTKLSAWEEVALNLYVDSENWSNYDKFGKVRDIQKRWKNMRDTYVKEIRYERKVEQGLALPRKKRYAYAELMEFLKPRKKSSSRCSSEKSSSEDNEEEMDADTNNRTSNSYMLMDEGYSSSHVNQFCKVMFDSHPQSDYSQLEHSQRNSPAPSDKPPSNVNSQKSVRNPNTHPDYSPTQYSHRNSSIYQSSQDLTSLNVSKRSVPNIDESSKAIPSTDLNLESSSIPLEQDGDKMFLLSLLPYFKKLNEERKLEARINVSRLLHEMLYKQT